MVVTVRFIQRLQSLPVLFAAAGLCAACSGDSQPEQAATPAASTVAQPQQPATQDPLANTAKAVMLSKGGAEVELSYEVLSKPTPGQPVDIKLSFLPRVDAQSLRAEIGAASPTVLSGELKPTFGDVKFGQINRHRFTMSVSAPAPDGIYVANVAVTLTRNGVDNSKSFAIPVAFANAPPPAAAGNAAATR